MLRYPLGTRAQSDLCFDSCATPVASICYLVGDIIDMLAPAPPLLGPGSNDVVDKILRKARKGSPPPSSTSRAITTSRCAEYTDMSFRGIHRSRRGDPTRWPTAAASHPPLLRLRRYRQYAKFVGLIATIPQLMTSSTLFTRRSAPGTPTVAFAISSSSQ